MNRWDMLKAKNEMDVSIEATIVCEQFCAIFPFLEQIWKIKGSHLDEVYSGSFYESGKKWMRFSYF